MNTYPIIKELHPQHTRNKSFYHKAFTVETETKIYLFSYHTNVAILDKINSIIINTWDGYSNTTSKHIHDFCLQCGDTSYSKKEWEKLYNPKDKIYLNDFDSLALIKIMEIVNKQIITL